MSKLTTAEIHKLTLKEINSLEAKLAEAKTEAKERAKADVRDKITALLDASGLTIQDVFNLKTKRKLPPKYINPDDRLQSWTGRGPRPRWLAAQIKAGKSLEDFEV
jgi:DNA-binding protein H-NS